MLIKKYNPHWVNLFAKLSHEIGAGLVGLTYQIVHIGSTAVPNLASKNIIDIDIIYSDSNTFDQIKSGLIAIGYYHNGDQGIKQREVFKRKGNQSHDVLDTIVHHLYVCPETSEALAQHLLFRDFLRRNDHAREKYQAMKYALAEEAGQDKKRYAQLKETAATEFVKSAIEQEKRFQRLGKSSAR